MSTRITNNMTVRNYLNGMRSNLGNLSRSNQKLTTQRAFNKASENVPNAAQALRIRKMLNTNERNIASAEALTNRLDTAETSLRSLSGIYDSMNDLVLHGMNGTLSSHDREILANEVEKLRDQALSVANAKYGDQYLFASAGNAGDAAPFAVGSDGLLRFNGNPAPIDDMFTDANGKVAYDDAGVVTEIAYNGKNYLDIGLGLTVTGDGAGMTLDTRSVVQSSLSGIEIFGYGTDEFGLPNNFFGLFDRIAADINGNNAEALGNELKALSNGHSRLLVAIAEVGSNTTFAEKITTQLDNDRLSLQELQNSLESVDLAEEIMHNSEFEMAWTVTLQLGSRILPKTIFDFL